MGTRADFYVSGDDGLKWLGSIAWNGYSVPEELMEATTPQSFENEVQAFLNSRNGATFPEQGWPWPWNDSETTDMAYVFHEERCVTCEWGKVDDQPPAWSWPDMTASAKVATPGSARSGLLVVSAR